MSRSIEKRFLDYLNNKNNEYLDTLKDDEGIIVRAIDGSKLASIFTTALHDFLEENLRADITWVGAIPGTPPSPDTYTGAVGLTFKFPPFDTVLPALDESTLDINLSTAFKAGMMQLPPDALFETPTVSLNPAGIILTTTAVTAQGRPIRTEEDAKSIGETFYRDLFTSFMSFIPLPLVTNRMNTYQGTLTTTNFYFKEE